MDRRTRYPQEVRERAVRMVFEHTEEHGTQYAAIRSISGKLRIPVETGHSFHAMPDTVPPQAGHRSAAKPDKSGPSERNRVAKV